jgi:hypothetical protein
MIMSVLNEYDLIVIGTGSRMKLASAFIQENPNAKTAVIDKDERASDLQKKEGVAGDVTTDSGNRATPPRFSMTSHVFASAKV